MTKGGPFSKVWGIDGGISHNLSLLSLPLMANSAESVVGPAPLSTARSHAIAWEQLTVNALISCGLICPSVPSQFAMVACALSRSALAAEPGARSMARALPST
eukprot:9039015-Pyramimonas_sp.AAC.1